MSSVNGRDGIESGGNITSPIIQRFQITAILLAFRGKERWHFHQVLQSAGIVAPCGVVGADHHPCADKIINLYIHIGPNCILLVKGTPESSFLIFDRAGYIVRHIIGTAPDGEVVILYWCGIQQDILPVIITFFDYRIHSVLYRPSFIPPERKRSIASSPGKIPVYIARGIVIKLLSSGNPGITAMHHGVCDAVKSIEIQLRLSAPTSFGGHNNNPSGPPRPVYRGRGRIL